MFSTILLYSLIESRVIKDKDGRFESFINEFSSFDIAGIGSGKQGFGKMWIGDLLVENGYRRCHDRKPILWVGTGF